MDDDEGIHLFGPRLLDDGRAVWVVPLTFGRARIITGRLGSPFIDDGW